MSRIETYCGVNIVREEQSETGQCMRGGGRLTKRERG